MGIIHEHEIIKTKLEIQEQALKNTVQEIHDNIGQILSLAKLHLGTLDFSKPEEVAQKTLNSNQLIGKAIKDLRKLAKHLDANYICQGGLLKSIGYELGLMPRDRAADPLLTIKGKIAALRKEEELMLFRIVQESVQYFLDNSSTSRISLQIDCQEETIEIDIHNREIQKNEEHTDNIPDKYISMIHSRSVMIGARLKVSNTQKNETTINITFPYTNH
ncbi:MAG: hypothetical protein J7621_17275 [Niastella sp.]|nr:hypothetical protein [Niastella sp.]